MMKMKPQDFLETGLLEQYVMGLLSAEEAKEVSEYIELHPTVNTQFVALQNTIANLAESHAIVPPPHVKANVLKSLSENNILLTASPKNNWKTYFLTAAAIVLGILSLISYNKIQSLKKEIDGSKKAYNILENDCIQAQKLSEKQNRIFAFYKNPETKSTQLIGNDKAPSFQLVAHYNKVQERITLNIASKGNYPNQKMICLWGDKGGKMILIAKLDEYNSDQFISFDREMTSLNLTLEDQSDSIDHPDVTQLISSVAI